MIFFRLCVILNINQFTECHFDPYLSDNMLSNDSIIRTKKWEKSLGQCDIAQNILAAEKVDKDDVFLFFGWFNQIEFHEGRYRYTPFSGHHKEGVQMLYGYLQIDEVIDINRTNKPFPAWVKSHPHFIQKERFRGQNVIYKANKYLSFDNAKPGAGLFKFKEDLILTEGNQSRTKWILPEIFHPDQGVEIKYLPEKDSKGNNKWTKLTGSKKVRVTASPRGQEFVVLKDDNKAIEVWAKELIKSHVVVN